jgi:hypothetical protein
MNGGTAPAVVHRLPTKQSWRRNLLDFARYTVALDRGGATQLLIDLAFLVTAAFAIGSSILGARIPQLESFLLVVAILRAAWAVRKLIKGASAFIRRKEGSLRSHQTVFAEVKIADVRPNAKEVALGFEPQRLTVLDEGTHVIHTSNRLNRDLWDGHDWRMRENPSSEAKVVDHIRKNKDTLLPLLTRHFVSVGRRQIFENERKLCLCSDPNPSEEELLFHYGGYFDSWMTNEACTRALLDDDGNIVVDGRSLFPADLGADTLCLRGLGHSSMNNHLGVSTLAFARDGVLMLSRQSKRAVVGGGQINASGSGSSDAGDFDTSRSTLQAAVKYGMRRELSEEQMNRPGIPLHHIRQTRIVGYFRWSNRGGKPEFVGVTTLDCNSAELEADGVEVSGCEPLYVPTLDVLVSELEIAIRDAESRRYSVSLRVNLACLRHLCEVDRDGVNDFMYNQR